MAWWSMVQPSTSFVAWFMPRSTRTRPVLAAQVRAYADKAEEYAEAARSELDARRFTPLSTLPMPCAVPASASAQLVRITTRS